MAKANLVSLDKRFDTLSEPLRRKAAGVFKFLKKDRAVVDIYLVGATAMRNLNREYRGKDSVTDVLAVEFPRDFPPEEKGYLGEVYLNPPHIRKKGYSLEEALVHGILHLLGFDHERKGDNIEMREKEKEVLEWLTSTYSD